jgi:hypothetical protein
MKFGCSQKKHNNRRERMQNNENQAIWNPSRKYVQKQFGKHYAKKSLLKSIPCALGLSIVYAAAIVGLLIATHGSDDDEESNTDQASASSNQASTSSGGSSFSLGRGDNKGSCPPRFDGRE